MCAAENHENPKAFVNPEWHPYGMQEDFLEGCLSIPGEFRNIRRPYNGTLTWDNLDSGTRYAAEFVGLEARIIGHEMDHLDGVLITDHEDRE